MTRYKIPNGLQFLLCVLLALCGHQTATGAGFIQGRVFNKSTNNILENARVIVDGAGIETLTDDGGYFSFRDIPAGNARLIVLFTGFETGSKEVQVTDNKTAEVEFFLVLQAAEDDETVLLEKYTVTTERLGAVASALHEQQTAVNLKNVVAFEEFGEMGEANPGEFLKYVPGVNITYGPNYAGSASIRGLSSNSTLVLLDGNEMSSTTEGRSFDLSLAEVANIERLEITKSTTPDMAANAIGGTLNIIGKSGFNSKFPVLNYNIFYTWNYMDRPATYNPSPFEQRQGTSSKLNSQAINPSASLSFLYPVSRSFAITINAAYNKRYYAMDYNYKNWDYTNGTYYQTMKYLTDQLAERKLGGVAIDWKPTGRVTFKASAQYSTNDTFTAQNTYNVNLPRTREGTGDSMHNTSNDGTITWGSTVIDNYRSTQTYRGAFKYDNNYWVVETDASYSASDRKRRDMEDGSPGNTSARISNLYISADEISKVLDGYVPRITATRTPGGTPINPYDPSEATVSALNFYPEDVENSVFSTRMHIKRNFSARVPFSIKIGAAYNENSLDVRKDRFTYRATPAPQIGAMDAIDYEYSEQNTWTVADGTRVSAYWIDNNAIYDYFKANPEQFTLDESLAFEQKVNNSREMTETVTAGFFRFDTRLFNNRVSIAAGVRYERTTDDGSGPEFDVTNIYQKDAYGNVIYTGTGDDRQPLEIPGLTALDKLKLQYTERGAKNNSSYGDFYPSINTSWAVTPNILVRAAYAKTISRPQLDRIMPGVSILSDVNALDEDDSLPLPEGEYPYYIDVGNTKLKPWSSHNYDLSLESYNIKGLTLTAGVFYKDISNFFQRVYYVATQSVLEKFNIPQHYEGSLVRTYENVGDGTVSGVEWSIRWDLRHVARWARGFNIFANGTHLRLGGSEGGNFTDFNPRIINYGIGMTRWKLVTKLSVTQRDRAYIGYTASSTATAEQNYPGGYRSYTRPQTIVDFNIRYAFSKKFSFYLSARNLFASQKETERIAVDGGLDAPGHAYTAVSQRPGVQLSLGIIGKL